MIVVAFTCGLKEGPLFRKLVGTPSSPRKELMERVSRYLRQVEAVVEKSKIENGAKNTRPNVMERFQSGSWGNHFNRGHVPNHIFQPFNRDKHGESKKELLEITDEKDTLEAKVPEKYTPKDSNKYYERHLSRGHDATECSFLKKEIERRLKSG